MVASTFVNALKKREQALTTLGHKIGPLAVSMVQQNMDGPFKANAPLTKQLKNNGAKPLKDTGDTRASINYQSQGDNTVVGTIKPHAKLINDGGTLKPKHSQKLAIPVNKQVKQRVNAWGVKKTLRQLESKGWKIFFRPKAIMGRAPPGAKPFGLKIKSKHNKSARKRKDGTYSENAKGVFYVLFYRSSGIKVPKREFMKLNETQEKTLTRIIERVLEDKT
ncbi:hypothetical protein RJD40_10575 [Vibrio scophthalmi]|uniref:hypothetical protein n=1 Tax=Vibrio scophthalmi TaxID=45658 RepID=UPI003AABA3A8